MERVLSPAQEGSFPGPSVFSERSGFLTPGAALWPRLVSQPVPGGCWSCPQPCKHQGFSLSSCCLHHTALHRGQSNCFIHSTRGSPAVTLLLQPWKRGHGQRPGLRRARQAPRSSRKAQHRVQRSSQEPGRAAREPKPPCCFSARRKGGKKNKRNHRTALAAARGDDATGRSSSSAPCHVQGDDSWNCSF